LGGCWERANRNIAGGEKAVIHKGKIRKKKKSILRSRGRAIPTAEKGSSIEWE